MVMQVSESPEHDKVQGYVVVAAMTVAGHQHHENAVMARRAPGSEAAFLAARDGASAQKSRPLGKAGAWRWISSVFGTHGRWSRRSCCKQRPPNPIALYAKTAMDVPGVR